MSEVVLDRVVWGLVFFLQEWCYLTYQQVLLLCPEIFQSVSALLYRRKIQLYERMYVSQMLEPFYFFSASAIIGPLFSLKLQESRDNIQTLKKREEH